MTRASLALLCVALGACGASKPTRDEVLQTAIEAGRLACQTALNDPATQWGDGAREYCEGVVNGCKAAP